METIFTVGEETTVGKIKEFEILENVMYVRMMDDNVYPLSSISKLPPQPQKLFTTKDGKDIFYGDNYWYVGGGYQIQKRIATYAVDFSTYSSKEAAEKYIANNKPQPQKEEQRIEVNSFELHLSEPCIVDYMKVKNAIEEILNSKQ